MPVQAFRFHARCRPVGFALTAWMSLLPAWAQAATPSPAGDTNTPVAPALTRAAALFKQEHWAEARTAYDQARALETNWSAAPVRFAVEGAVACSVKLQEWDDCVARATEFVSRTAGTPAEAIGERFLGGLYLSMPHHGTKRGSAYLRGQWTQGVQVYSYRKDAAEALKHYERARELLLKHTDAKSTEEAASLAAERIGINFDLVTALSTQQQNAWYRWPGCWWWWWDAPMESTEESSALDDADYEEPRWMSRGWGGETQEEPTGIPLGPDGKPQFISTPNAYSASLGPGAKIRFLLEEIQALDQSKNKDEAARALFRHAMIARTLYGPDSASGYGSTRVQYDHLGRPLPSEPDPDAPKKNIWELAEDEAITLVGGKLRLITLPPSESPVALLRGLERRYPQSEIRPEAHYARALYLQSRQQFPEATAEYHQFLELYPQHKRAADVRQQLQRIAQPDVALSQTGLWLPDSRPELKLSYRNTEKIEFTALKIDLIKYVQDSLELTPTNGYWNYRDLQYYFFNDDRWKKYLGAQAARWSQSVQLPPGHRVGETNTAAPLPDAGAYLIEARLPGSSESDQQAVLSRVLLLVTDIALVQKNVYDNGLLYVCDARTGQPLPEKSVRFYEHWSVYNQKNQKNDLFWETSTATTDTNGVVLYSRKQGIKGSQVDAIVAGEGNRIAFSFFQNWNEAAHVQGDWLENGPRNYLVTDRPVYRPGTTVHFKLWIRNLEQRQFAPPRTKEQISVELYDARNNPVKTFTLKTDDFGGASGEYTLPEEPPLGVWHLRINSQYPDARFSAGALFRVEEYKKPEFEVSVKPAKSRARLGEKIEATISAQYYFGAPVANATVSYKVFREDYHHVYFGPGEYDWLYGRGYGRHCYPYPWFPWWSRWGGYLCAPWWPDPYVAPYPFPWGYYGGDQFGYRRLLESNTRKALRELVATGQGKLLPDGTYKLQIDTGPAAKQLTQRDHRYTVEAEVRDESRRTIEGTGSVLATRQEFYAFVEANAGWYQPRNEAFIEVRTLSPDNTPVAAQGEVVVRRISYSGPNHQQPEESVVKRWNARTDPEGRLSFRYPIPSEGQYRITFTTRDSTRSEVQGNAVFWVNGPGFDGRVYRFNDLEIIADKRAYRVGDTAHLLIHTAESNSRLLFADHVSHGVLLSWRFLDLPARATVIDLPIEEKHVPNFHVEATLVRNARVHTETRELFVPPTDKLLNVTVLPDKPVYQPGETGKVSVTVTDASGKPAPAQVALTAYDEAVTYIQDEFGPTPRLFFYGQRRQHSPHVQSSVDLTLPLWGNFQRPEWFVYQGGEPEGWRGSWKLEESSLRLAGSANRFSGGFGGGGAFGAAASGMEMDALGSLTKANQPMSSAAPFSGKPARDLSGDRRDREEISPEPSSLVEPEIRSDFADTAHWAPDLLVDDTGTAHTTIRFPQSLTSWRLHAYAMTKNTHVGDGTNTVRTTRNLLVRLQAPRFFVERDEVVISANVHNYLKQRKRVTAQLTLPSDLFEPLDAKTGQLSASFVVPANGEHRFDWPVRVKKSGFAQITVKALTDTESDGMRLGFPVFVHGIDKTIAQSGSFRTADEGARTLKLDLPEDIDPEQTQLRLSLSPSLAGVMIDALPYLAGYPYGCVEQTMSRFYPSVLVKDTLKKLGTDLETVAKQRKQARYADLTNRFARAESPVFDTEELNRMVRAGLDRIYFLQRNDGGWGWWREDDSSPYQTAYVIQGLRAARDAGITVDSGVYERALNYLQNSTEKEIAKPKNEQQLGALQTQAYIAYVLSAEQRLNNDETKKWFQSLYDQRGELNIYGRALLALALHQEKRTEEAQTTLRNLLQFVARDDSNETAWVRTPNEYWWFWWNNDIEANAWALKAIVTIDPKSDLAPRLVKWLLNNRRHGYYWRSTRDTALVIAAMVDYMRASGEADPDYSLMVNIDGRPVKELKLTRQNFFTFENEILLHGLQIAPGPHTVTLTKSGSGALYYSAYLSYFTREEDVKGAGNEVLVDRKYYKLVPKTERVIQVKATQPHVGASHPGGDSRPAGAGRTELRDAYERILLKNGDPVTSGDKVEVVLTIKAKNTYDYLIFEDMKPAGCEPMELRSGGRWAGGLCANLELRDEKVVFFIGLLDQGQHVLRYKLRAETPGHFHALPTKAWAMYAPEIKSISDEQRLRITE